MKRPRSPSSLTFENGQLEIFQIVSRVTECVLKAPFMANQLREQKVLSRKLFLYPDPTKRDAEIEVVQEGILFLSPTQYRLLANTSDFVLEHKLKSYVPFQCSFLEGAAKVWFQHVRLRTKDDHLEWNLDILKYEFDDACYFGRHHCQDIPKEDRKFEICKGTRCPECRSVVECDTHPKNEPRICKRDHTYFKK